MNFTKEYIELCRGKVIQGLRRDLLTGDVIRFKNPVSEIEFVTEELLLSREYDFNRNRYIWLPTGDQLDDEIVKICKEVDYEYLLRHTSWRKATSSLGKSILIRGDYIWCLEIWNALDKIIAKSKNANPLIAKIKLLKALLEG